MKENEPNFKKVGEGVQNVDLGGDEGIERIPFPEATEALEGEIPLGDGPFVQAREGEIPLGVEEASFSQVGTPWVDDNKVQSTQNKKYNTEPVLVHVLEKSDSVEDIRKGVEVLLDSYKLQKAESENSKDKSREEFLKSNLLHTIGLLLPLMNRMVDLLEKEVEEIRNKTQGLYSTNVNEEVQKEIDKLGKEEDGKNEEVGKLRKKIEQLTKDGEKYKPKPSFDTQPIKIKENTTIPTDLRIDDPGEYKFN